MNDTGTNLSALMCVYQGDVPEQLDTAIDSIVNQTWMPDEIVLVEDGPIGESLTSVIDEWRQRLPGILRIVTLLENVGLGLALKVGVVACSHDIIARMDADDISVPERFEKQCAFLKDHPEVDAVSCWVGFFYNSPMDIIQIEKKPETHEKLERIARFRSPLPHAPVMYRRSSVLRAGNYSAEWRVMQDYHLWVRMLLCGAQFHCLQEVLYKVRVSDSFFRRRKSFARAMLQVRLQREFHKMGFISTPCFLRNCTARVLLCSFPNSMTRALRSRFT